MVKQAMRDVNQVKRIERDGHSRVGDQTRADASQAALHLQVRARTTQLLTWGLNTRPDSKNSPLTYMPYMSYVWFITGVVRVRA